MQLTEKQKENGREAIEYIEREFGEDAVFLVSDINLKEVVALKNMWPDRARRILEVMQNGLTFQEAQRHTRLLYDTKHFGEILGRLARARGILLRAAITCCRNPSRGRSLFDEHVSVNEIWGSLLELEKQIAEYELTPTETGCVRKSKFNCSSISNDISRGQVRSAFAFIRKCARDLPVMSEKTGQRPTGFQRSYILMELGKLKMAMNLINDAINYPNSGFRETNSNTDPFGVGTPYNKYVSFLAKEVSNSIQLPRDFTADCFLACWLAAKFLASSLPLIQFVAPCHAKEEATCSINIGLQNNPESVTFSAKNSEGTKSVSRIVYDHLLSNGNEVSKYRRWVEVIEEDLLSETSPSFQLANSRNAGVHSVFKNLIKATDNPVAVYNAFSAWLDGKEHNLD